MLSTHRARSEAEMEIQARALLDLGARSVLIKGGHGEGAESVDLLDRAGTVSRLSARRITIRKTRTGVAARCLRRLRRGLPKVSISNPQSSRPKPMSLRHCRRRHAQSRTRPRARASFSCDMERRHDDATKFHGSRLGSLLECSPRRRSREHKRTSGAWLPRGRSVCRVPACRPSALLSAFARSRAVRLDIAVYAAGEVVPAFEVLDAVGNGVADIGHTASFYWQGKMPASAFFTTVPFGLTPGEHVAWVDAGGGQASLGRALRTIRREAFHGRQHRRLHGWLVPARTEEPR